MWKESDLARIVISCHFDFDLLCEGPRRSLLVRGSVREVLVLWLFFVIFVRCICLCSILIVLLVILSVYGDCVGFFLIQSHLE